MSACMISAVNWPLLCELAPTLGSIAVACQANVFCNPAGIDVLRRAGAAVTVASVEPDLTVTCGSPSSRRGHTAVPRLGADSEHCAAACGHIWFLSFVAWSTKNPPWLATACILRQRHSRTAAW